MLAFSSKPCRVARKHTDHNFLKSDCICMHFIAKLHKTLTKWVAALALLFAFKNPFFSYKPQCLQTPLI